MPAIAIAATIANLPEGWEGTPQEFAEWLTENLSFEANGDFLTGKIGGSNPESDIGLWVDGKRLKVWSNDKYTPIETVPVGVCFPWASANVAPPEDYLFCQGQIVKRADYPELFSAIGTTWSEGSIASDSFRLPDFRGRGCVGAGAGDYNPTGSTGGKLTERTIGEYIGLEWLKHKESTPANAPSEVTFYTPKRTKRGAFHSGLMPPSVVMPYIIKVR